MNWLLLVACLPAALGYGTSAHAQDGECGKRPEVLDKASESAIETITATIRGVPFSGPKWTRKGEKDPTVLALNAREVGEYIACTAISRLPQDDRCDGVRQWAKTEVSMFVKLNSDDYLKWQASHPRPLCPKSIKLAIRCTMVNSEPCDPSGSTEIVRFVSYGGSVRSRKDAAGRAYIVVVDDVGKYSLYVRGPEVALPKAVDGDTWAFIDSSTNKPITSNGFVGSLYVDVRLAP